MLTTFLRLFARFAQLGGMAGTAVFLTQGEFLNAVRCTLVASLCICFIAMILKLIDSKGGNKPQ